MISQETNVTEYVGRVVDLLAYQGVQLIGDQQLTQAIVQADEGGELCTGIQKLMQRWLIEFLTITGSLAYLPLRGCDFMRQIQAGQLHTVVDLRQAFNLSAQQVKTNLQSEETAATPLDEAYGGVVLNSVELSLDTVIISVTLTSQAGTAADAILPINVRTD